MSLRPEDKIVPSSWPKGWLPPIHEGSQNTWRLVMGYLLMSLLLLPFLMKISLEDIPAVQEILGYILFCLCTWPVVWHFSRRQPGLPVFPIICMVYAVSLALPVYYSEPVLSVVGRLGTIRVLDQDTTMAIGYSIIGVISMQFGFYFFQFSILNLIVPCLRLELDPRKGQRLMVFLGFFGVALSAASMSGSIVIHPRYLGIFVLFGRVAILSTSFLYVQYLRGRLEASGKMFLIVILVLNIGIGLGMGAVRNALDPILAIGAVHWMIKRRISWKLALVAGVFFLIMQAVKGQFRELVWYQGTANKSSAVDRVKLWGDLAQTVVARVFVENKQETANSVRNSFGRMDMIHLFGHAIAETPRHIPFQEGKTYSYFLYMLVPRAFWNTKPTAQAGNEFFGLEYGLQGENSIGTTSIGLPHIVESYINFGPFGLVFVMLLMGMFYAAIDRIFNHEAVGAGGVAIYATVLFTLVNIETCTAATFGALPQTILAYSLLLRMVRAKGTA